VTNPISPVNTNERDTDPVLLAAGTQGYVKRGVQGTAITPSSSDEDAVAQLVGTHVDGATPAATDPVVVIGAKADQTAPASVTEGLIGWLRMSLARALHVVQVADVATLSSVASQDTNISLLAANVNRIGLLVFNDDTGTLYLKYGTTASTSSYTVQIPGGGYWEMPLPAYVGAIDGIWVTSGSGSVRMTELT